MNAKLPLATIACLCAAAALAQPPDESGETRGPRGGRPAFPLMTALDVDNDGVISPREIKKAVTALKTLDADGDGRLTEDELRPQFAGGDRPNDGPGPAGQRGPGGLGGGQGGPPSAEAFVARALQFDTDQDGKLDQNELAKLAEEFARGPIGRGPAGPRGLGASGAGGPAGVTGGPAGGRRQRGGNANSNR